LAEEAAASAERDLYAAYGLAHPADHIPLHRLEEMAKSPDTCACGYEPEHLETRRVCVFSTCE
jgi:hypothetical protein